MFNPKQIFWCTLLAVCLIAFIMFTEYRVIMTHQQIEVHYDGTVSSTIFGITDLYNTGESGATW